MLDGVHVSGTSDEFELWLSAERDAIRRTLLGALNAEAEVHAARGEAGRAADYARRARDLAPADEVIARSLIRIMLAAGDRGGALHAYDWIEGVLRADFGVQPSDETRALVAPLRDESSMTGSDSAVVQRQPYPGYHPLLPAPPRRMSLVGAWIAISAIVIVGAAFVARRLPPGVASEAISPWRPLTQMQGQFRGRVGVAAFMDSTGGLIVFGGALPLDPGQTVDVRGEMWRLSSLRDESRAGFVRAHPRGESPVPRWLASMVSDDGHNRAIMHGGATGATSPCLNDTWVLDAGSGSADALQWRRVSTRGDSPPRHAGVSAMFDSAGRRLVLFGGNDCFASYANDVWVLDFDDSDLASGKWSRIEPGGASGSPPPRNAAAAWLDGSGDRLFVAGGMVGASTSSDLWVMEGLRSQPGHTVWRPLSCSGVAPARTLHMAVFDDRTGSALLFGGMDARLTYRRELFRLTGLAGDASSCRWEQLPTAEPWPQARTRPLMIVDPRSRQLVLFGGEYQNTSFADVWTIERPFGR